MPDIPEIEPTEFRAGTTVQWTKDLSTDYPADAGWSLQYIFINASTKITVNASASGKIFAVTISAATSAAYTAGVYKWIARVTKASEKFDVDSGTCEVLADLAALSTSDQRSHAKKCLDAIEAVLESRATKDQMQYRINDRELARTPISDLLKLRDRYRQEYQQEQSKERIANGEGSGRKVLVRFTK